MVPGWRWEMCIRDSIRMVTWIVPGMTLLYNGIARWIDMGVRKEYLLMAILYVGMG